MWRKAAQLGGSLAAGVVADRLSQQKTETNSQPQPAKPLRTGNEILGGLSERVKVPQDAQSPLMQGATNQVQNRVSLADKLATLAKEPKRAADNASSAMDQVKEEAKFLHGAAKIAQGGQLTASDGARLAKAGVESAENSLVATAKGMFAAATTSKSTVEQLGQTVTDRATHEAKTLASGVAVSQGLATVVGMVPHPAAKVASAVIRTTGPAAAGAKASEAMRELNADVAGPVRKEIVAIAKEKSQQPSPSTPKTDS